MISSVQVGPRLAREEGVRAIGVLSGLVTMLAASGCFYFDVVNAPPVAVIEAPSEPIHVNQTVALSARRSTDDELEGLSFDWDAASCAGGTCVELGKGEQVTFLVAIPSHDTVRVTLQVVDKHGARGVAMQDLTVTDRAPDLVVKPITAPGGTGTYPVSKPISVGAQANDPDGDSVTYTVALRSPPASDPNKVVFGRDAPGVASWTLVPDVNGHWEVEVTADDGYGGRTVRTQALEVATDQPPCIATTSPAAPVGAVYVIARGDGARRFAVDSVQDDLDPWPAADSRLAFRWFLGAGSAPPEVAGHDVADFTIDPADYFPGDVVTLRVEVQDRVARTLPCAPDQPVCSFAGDACVQRLSWTVEMR
jgi:hypothetical protein